MSRLEKFLFLPIVVGIIVLGACSSNVWDEVPSPITSFVEQYYPGSGLSSYNQTDNLRLIYFRSRMVFQY